MTQESDKRRAATTSEVLVEKLVYGGEGLARLDGEVVLTPFVLPGELVSVRTQQVKAGLLRGSDAVIKDAAPQRVKPQCPYFGTCGGCDYQHAEYGFQLEQKKLILRETLQRIGGVQYADEIGTIAGPPWEYRNRIQLHFSEGRVGFNRAGSHELCAIERCPISSPKLNEVIGKLAWAVKRPEWPKFLRSLEVFTNETDVQLNIVDTTRPIAARFFDWCGTFIETLAKNSIGYEAAGAKFQISRGSFFQVNRFLVDALADEVLRDARGQSAIDLYAGVGLFSVPLAKRFEQVQAVERGGPGFRDLQANAIEAGEQLKPEKGSAEQFLAGLKAAPDLIVADPPRAGLGKDATGELLRIRPHSLKIVSCDPTTMARDIRKLLEAYQIQRMVLVDLFPQTYHFEVVVHLQRH